MPPSSQLITEGLIRLFQLDTTMLGGPWFYFTSAEDAEHEIMWGGLPYAPLPMQAEGFEMTTKGAIPTPSVTISNLYGAGNLLLDSFNGLLGAQLVRILTLRRFLDDGSTPDPNAMISRDKFTVAQKTAHNALSITFKLAAQMDQEGVMLPRRLVMRDFCSHVYRRWVQTGSIPESGLFDYNKATCPYTGGTYFNVNDQSCPDYLDQCSRTVTGCQKRFGGAPLPARFFPAVGRVK